VITPIALRQALGACDAIVGARRTESADGCCRHRTVKLSAADLEEISRLLDTNA